jgi:uncharacterized membrane protein YcaP (DUF421 family)
MTAWLQSIDALFGFSASEAKELTAVQVCLRAVLVFLILIAYFRFAKKRFLGQATGLDAILFVVIGSIASRAISGTAPFFPSMAGSLMLIGMHWLISYITRDSKTLGALIKGHDTLLVRDGQVDHEAMAAAHMSGADLAEELRLKGIGDVAEILEARLERNGKLSVIKFRS